MQAVDDDPLPCHDNIRDTLQAAFAKIDPSPGVKASTKPRLENPMNAADRDSNQVHMDGTTYRLLDVGVVCPRVCSGS